MRARPAAHSWDIGGRRGPVVLVAAVGAASGARAAAAALACAASEPDRAALLIDLDDGRPPRPSLVATAGARALEERVAAHLPGATVAARGCICQLRLPTDSNAVDRVAATLPLVRESAGILHVPPPLVREVLEEPRVQATAALLRADLSGDRPLTALATRDLRKHGLQVAVLKHPLPWLTARISLLGALPAAARALPIRHRDRLLSTDDNKLRQCDA